MAKLIYLHTLLLSLCLMKTSAVIVYPCGQTGISNSCVGEYFANLTGCSLTLKDSSSLDPYQLGHFYFATPFFNVTEDRYDVTVSGASEAFVDTFYYNTTSGRAVLSILWPHLEFEGDAHIHGYIPKGETFEVVTHYQVNFTELTTTTLFFDYGNPSFQQSHTSSDIPITPTYINGDGLENAAATDARVANLVAAYASYPMVATLEAFQYRGPALVDLYFQYKLCRLLQ